MCYNMPFLKDTSNPFHKNNIRRPLILRSFSKVVLHIILHRVTMRLRVSILNDTDCLSTSLSITSVQILKFPVEARKIIRHIFLYTENNTNEPVCSQLVVRISCIVLCQLSAVFAVNLSEAVNLQSGSFCIVRDRPSPVIKAAENLFSSIIIVHNIVLLVLEPRNIFFLKSNFLN